MLLYISTYNILADNQLSENQKLKAQNYQLKMQLTQCQVQTVQGRLTTENAQLVEEFRKTLGASPTDIFDWETLTFKDK